MNRLLRILVNWLPLMVLFSGLCILIYAAVQQNYRMNANDPQVQMAEDLAFALDKGQSPQEVLPSARVNLNNSLAPFVILFDKTGNPVASTGLLNDTLPQFPLGALTAADKSGENRVTWQPEAGLRFATIIHTYKDGYVVAGRSLREVEKRIDQTTLFTGITWLGGLIASLVLFTIKDYVLHPKENATSQN